MSVSLFVRLKHALSFHELKTGIKTELRSLLGLDQDVVVSARFDECFTEGSRSGEQLTPESCRVVCWIEGYPEEVPLMAFSVPVEVEPGSNVEQEYVSIRWHFKKGALCWVLVAAAALAVAQAEDSRIEDNSGYFSVKCISEPDEFRSSLRLAFQDSDLQAAAEAFWARLPKSAEIVQWLQSRR